MIGILNVLILFAVNPMGFVILMSSLILFEYVIAKSIIKDTSIVNIKMVSSYIKNYALKYTSRVLSYLKAPYVIFKKKKVVIDQILSPAEIAISDAKLNNWFNS